MIRFKKVIQKTKRKENIMKRKKNNNQPDIPSTDTEFPVETDLSDTDVLSAVPAPPKKKLPGWVIIPVLGVLILAFLGLSFLTSGQSSGTDAGTALATVRASRGTVSEEYNSTGTIESENTKTYYSPVTAPISQCNAVVGQAVREGDLLVSFDTSTLERDNQQAQLTLQSSLNASRATKAQNAKAAEAASAAASQAAAQANALENEVNTLASQVAQAKAQYEANAKAAEAQTQENAARRQELENEIGVQQQIIDSSQNIIDSTETGYAGKRADLDAALNIPEAERTEEQKKTISDLEPVFQAYDEAVAARSQAQTKVSALQGELSKLPDISVDDAGYTELKAQYDAKYAEWQAAVQAAGSVSADTGMTAEELKGLDISDNLAELAALTPEELLQKGREGVKADMNGVIASAEAAQSGTAAQGGALFTIASTDNVRVKIEISPDDYAKVKTGTTAVITMGESTYEGTLTAIDRIALPNAQGNSVIGAQVHINNPDGNICIGASAKVRMTIAEAKDVIVIPTEAVNASSDGDFVYVIEDGIVRERPVELGVMSATQAEVVNGLSDGDLVVNDLTNLDIHEGMRAVAQETESE